MELKSCPFCGNFSQIHLLEIPTGYEEEGVIQCQLCGACGPHSSDPENSWNTRELET